MDEYTWLDGSRLRVYELRKGSRVMRVSAVDACEAVDIAGGLRPLLQHIPLRHWPPYDKIVQRTWPDHLIRVRQEREGCSGR